MGRDPADPQATTLREYLRGTTSPSHDLLDAAMRPASDWRSAKDYVRFLMDQYTARLSVEAWLTQKAPAHLRPPRQTPLLLRDLQKLGAPSPAQGLQFELDYRSQATAVGAAWVLAGSSLGNRAMLNDMKQTLPEDVALPHEFLSSRAMTAFWKVLRKRVEAPAGEAEAKEAARSAVCVFEHFLSVAGSPADSTARELESVK